MEKEHETREKGKDNSQVRAATWCVLLAVRHDTCESADKDNDGSFEGHDAGDHGRKTGGNGGGPDIAGEDQR